MLGGGRHTGKALLGVTTVLLLGCSAFFAHRAYSKDQQFRQWSLDSPCDVAIDLSRPGTTRSPFIQTCSIAHGEGVFLKLDAEGSGPPAEDPSDRLGGLAGQVAIHDLEGREIVRQPFSASAKPGYFPDEVCLAYIDPFATGRYTITLEVESGAAGLSGVRQRIVARYLLCGLEALPAVMDVGWAFLCGLPGLVMAVVLLRKRSPAHASTASP